MKFLLKNIKIKTPTQTFLDIVEIVGSIVILRNGDYIKIIEVQPVNFSLLNPEEQMFLIKKFAAFLNSLDFPIQIFVNNQRIVMNEYLDYLNSLSENLAGKPTLLSYLKIYYNFIQNITEFKTIFDKKFYIVIKHHAQVYNPKAPANVKKTLLEAVESHLAPQVTYVITNFKHMGLGARQLRTSELAKLFYRLYNPSQKTVEFLDNTKVNL